MTTPPASRSIWVEGVDDVDILSIWFPAIQLRPARGKDSVRSKVNNDPAAWGLRDRDFASDTEVVDSRDSECRVAILRRYCIENYLLEPDIIGAAAAGFSAYAVELAAWTDESLVQTRVLEWGKELALYAAANSIVNQWRSTIEDDFLHYFGPLPALPYDAVLSALQGRLRSLMRPEDVPAALGDRHEEVLAGIATWDGLHRWINGKVLLEECLYPRAFAVTHLGKPRLRDALIDAGRERIPMELIEVSQRWSA